MGSSSIAGKNDKDWSTRVHPGFNISPLCLLIYLDIQPCFCDKSKLLSCPYAYTYGVNLRYTTKSLCLLILVHISKYSTACSRLASAHNNYIQI